MCPAHLGPPRYFGTRCTVANGRLPESLEVSAVPINDALNRLDTFDISPTYPPVYVEKKRWHSDETSQGPRPTKRVSGLNREEGD